MNVFENEAKSKAPPAFVAKEMRGVGNEKSRNNDRPCKLPVPA